MTKKQRVLAALEGREVDRVPVSFWRHIQNDAGTGPALGRESAEKHLSFFRATDLDFIKIMQDGFTAPFDLESVKTVQDLRAVRPVGRKHPFVADYVERAKWVNDLLAEEVYTYCNIFSPYMLLRKLGDERLGALLQEDESAFTAALQAVGESLRLICELLLKECGCLGLFLCFQGANRFSQEDYARMIAPSDLAVLEEANQHSNYNILHCCAWDGGPNHLAVWQNYPARAVNWAIHTDGYSLAEGRTFFGERTVMGGFDNRVGRLLFSGSKEEIQAETRQLIHAYTDKTGSARGLILGADCSLLPPFELERLNWVTQAVQEYSQS